MLETKMETEMKNAFLKFNFIYLFIFDCVGSSLLCGLFSSCGECGLLSYCRAQALGHMHFSSFGRQAH